MSNDENLFSYSDLHGLLEIDVNCDLKFSNENKFKEVFLKNGDGPVVLNFMGDSLMDSSIFALIIQSARDGKDITLRLKPFCHIRKMLEMYGVSDFIRIEEI